MHALVLAVLMGRGGLDKLGKNTELYEPDAKPREPAQSVGSEGCAVVGSDPLREPVPPEEPRE